MRDPKPIISLPLVTGVLLVGILAFPCQHVVAQVPGGSDSSHETDGAIPEAFRSALKQPVHAASSPAYFVDYNRHLTRLYQGLDYQLFWSHEGLPTAQARDVIQILLNAARQGLRSANYDVQSLQNRSNELSAAGAKTWDALILFDTKLSIELMRYLSHLNRGRINPREMGFDLSIERKRLDLVGLVKSISQSKAVADTVREIEPKLRIYERLKEALARYRGLAKDSTIQPLPVSESIHPGDNYEASPALSYLLMALGDLEDPAGLARSTNLYDGELVEAVKRFQRRHGLTVDGIIGPATFGQLNVAMATRAEQIELALERLRWLPVPADGPHVVANIPAFELYALDVQGANERLALKMDVIVGSAVEKNETPVFSAEMRYLVFRPYWNIPRSIIAKEILPKADDDPGYLERHDYEIVDRFSGDAKVYVPTDETMARLRSGRLKLRQRPGPNNALGLVKFMFPNVNSIYMHSTPAKRLFRRTRRDFSHGCIRVEDPVGLASFVLSGQDEVWDEARIKKMMSNRRSSSVRLKNPIPVYIFYTTALVRENGEVSFFRDIYGHDARLQTLLAARW